MIALRSRIPERMSTRIEISTTGAWLLDRAWETSRDKVRETYPKYPKCADWSGFLLFGELNGTITSQIVEHPIDSFPILSH